MKEPAPRIPFRARLILLALAGLLALGLLYRNSRDHPAPLRQSSLDLRYHELSLPDARGPPRVVLIGGSEILGVAPALAGLLPPHSVVELFQPDTNLVNIMALADLALRVHPRFVVVSVQPFTNRFVALGSAAAFLNADLLEPYLPANLWRFLHAQNSLRLGLFFRTLAAFEWLDNALIPAQRALRGVRDSWLGKMPPPIVQSTPDPYLLRLLHGPQLSLTPDLPALLHGLNELVTRQGARLVIYQSPFSTEAYLAEKTEASPWRDENLRATLAHEKVPFFDYRDLFSSTADFFSDAIHVTPAGADLLAASLLENLAGAGLPGNPCETDSRASPCLKIRSSSVSVGPCTGDRSRLCAGLAKDRQENCLWQHFDQLSPACRVIRQRLLSFDPCLKGFADYCDRSAGTTTRSCLWRHYERLPPDCQAVLEFNLERHPCARDRGQKCRPGEDSNRCLWRNYPKLDDACRQSYEDQLTLDPCVRDRALYCPKLAGPEKFRACLEQSRPRLSADCQAMLPAAGAAARVFPLARDEAPCVAERDSLCGLTPPKDQFDCLWRQKERTSPSCQALLDKTAGPAPCELDRRLRCPGIAEKQKWVCLGQRRAELAPQCRRLEAAREKLYPCEREIALRCPMGTAGERTVCLFEHLQDLNPDCARRMNAGPAGEMFDFL